MKYEEFIFAGAGKRQFTLSEDSISVAKGDTLLLKGLEPEYRIVQLRSSACYVGLIGILLGLVFFVYGLVFNSEDMAEMRTLASFRQGVGLLNRQVTVQVGEEEPVTGVVKGVRTGDGEPQLTINSESYALHDVIHARQPAHPQQVAGHRTRHLWVYERVEEGVVLRDLLKRPAGDRAFVVPEDGAKTLHCAPLELQASIVTGADELFWRVTGSGPEEGALRPL